MEKKKKKNRGNDETKGVVEDLVWGWMVLTKGEEAGRRTASLRTGAGIIHRGSTNSQTRFRISELKRAWLDESRGAIYSPSSSK